MWFIYLFKFRCKFLSAKFVWIQIIHLKNIKWGLYFTFSIKLFITLVHFLINILEMNRNSIVEDSFFVQKIKTYNRDFLRKFVIFSSFTDIHHKVIDWINLVYSFSIDFSTLASFYPKIRISNESVAGVWLKCKDYDPTLDKRISRD